MKTEFPLVSPAELRGVQRQSEIGFLTLLEHLRYCQVGSNLKNPRSPVWVLASETHLTGRQLIKKAVSKFLLYFFLLIFLHFFASSVFRDEAAGEQRDPV